ncbi:hypothetical protein HW132_35260 [Brasilonema sp. CT11]|nr:hypothetical protein [Brasilonema sp. CT11]
MIFIASHQEQMIKTGVMKTLIKSLRSKNMKVFFKAAEVLFYFDGTINLIIPTFNNDLFAEKYQKEMIKNGMIKQLMKVLTSKSSSAEARTKSMSLLQYFDST